MLPRQSLCNTTFPDWTGFYGRDEHFFRSPGLDGLGASTWRGMVPSHSPWRKEMEISNQFIFLWTLGQSALETGRHFAADVEIGNEEEQWRAWSSCLPLLGVGRLEVELGQARTSYAFLHLARCFSQRDITGNTPSDVVAALHEECVAVREYCRTNGGYHPMPHVCMEGERAVYTTCSGEMSFWAEGGVLGYERHIDGYSYQRTGQVLRIIASTVEKVSDQVLDEPMGRLLSEFAPSDIAGDRYWDTMVSPPPVSFDKKVRGIFLYQQ